MNGFVKILVLISALAVGNVVYKLYDTKPVTIPPETWWGVGQPKEKEDTSIRPFKINFSDEGLQDLKARLKNARPFTPPLEGIEQQYGMNTNLLKKIVDFWLNKYDWREREKFLNQYPQFHTNIQGLDIHFIHVKPTKLPSGIRVLPLLLLHGWPGSVREFYEIIPLLTTVQKDRDFVFEVIVPSLPGYGFSQGAAKPGLGVPQAAVIFKNLMARLDFDKFYIQGGDWGAGITTAMAKFYPDLVKGIHLNMCVSDHPLSIIKLVAGSFWPSLVVKKEHQDKIYPLSNLFSHIMLEFGYFHLQATKPDTVGVGLNDSPVGLAAYILEKFTTWTNEKWKDREDGGLTDRFTYSKLLDNVMIYWISGSITTSMRFYAESVGADNSGVVQVPTACAVFENEILYQPENIFKHQYPKVLQANEYDGGHFAAFEVPRTLSKDIWLAVSKFEGLQSK